MIRYLLDTNTISNIIRHRESSCARRFEALERNAACTSIIVVAELRFGLAKQPSPKREHDVAAVLSAMEVLPFGSPADDAYGTIRAGLERSGTLIGPNDLLIAAHALSANCIMVTGNENEFRRVPGLVVENWLHD